MCLVAFFYKVFEDAPIVVGANREEVYARGGDPPRVFDVPLREPDRLLDDDDEQGDILRALDGTLRAVGGVDPVSGGTWLGVNERGLLIAITNRPKSRAPAAPISRGLLARALLGCPTHPDTIHMASMLLKPGNFAGCNLLSATGREASVFHAGDHFRSQDLRPGLHLLTANNMDDCTDARQEFARAWLHQRAPRSSTEAVTALQELCGLTGDAPMCLRGPDRGTVSSAVIALREPLAHSTYLHAQGPPDCTPYADYSPLLQEIAPSRKAGG